VIAADRVRYVGEPVAVVLGDSPALAEDGVGAIAIDIEELPPVPDRDISGRHEILLYEEAGTNAAMVFTGVKGDADAAFRDADYVRRDRFAVQRYTALPMEPRGLLAEWDAAQGGMTVLGAAKVPFFNRDTLAAMLGLSPPQVDLIENDVGGGFGARGEFYPEDFLIPVRGAACRPPGPLARGPARASDIDEPRAPGGLRGREPSPALSRAAEPVQRRRRGSTSRRMARSRSMSARRRSRRTRSACRSGRCASCTAPHRFSPLITFAYHQVRKGFYDAGERPVGAGEHQRTFCARAIG
jgi:Molybdopterin-binding domain of aldehyde dehydrogenase